MDVTAWLKRRFSFAASPEPIQAGFFSNHFVFRTSVVKQKKLRSARTYAQTLRSLFEFRFVGPAISFNQ